jgi:hypothetical protein
VTRNGTEVLYMDTSAFLKAVWDEAESVALSGFIGNRVTVSSKLLAVEARRSTLLVAETMLPRTDLVLADVRLIAVTDTVLESAGRCQIRYCELSTPYIWRPPSSFARMLRRWAPTTRGWPRRPARTD